MNLGTAHVIQANAKNLPIADDSVDLIITSPPYFALRSYQDGGEHYEGQIGSEASPAEFLEALLEVTRECMRVLKPTGSLWVNLGDKYVAGTSAGRPSTSPAREFGGYASGQALHESDRRLSEADAGGIRTKSLMGLPWRYAIRCIDELGLILRAEVIWSKPNGMPESVTDRVRMSHEPWFHFTKQPRYFTGLDEIREPHVGAPPDGARFGGKRNGNTPRTSQGNTYDAQNPLGKTPCSVWSIPTQPLKVPAELGVDHFAAFPTEWPRRIIQGWSPTGICTVCDEPRRPTVDRELEVDHIQKRTRGRMDLHDDGSGRKAASAMGITDHHVNGAYKVTITGYECACPAPTAPTRAAVVLDPFGGSGTTAMVAKALGRHGISVDMSADYCRLAEWRTNDRDQLAKVLGIAKAEAPDEHQLDLFSEGAIA